MATADLFRLLLGSLVARLRYRWPQLAHTDAAHDAAIKVLTDYFAAPERYDPARMELLGWLALQAHADLKNDYASARRRFERSWIVESELSPDTEARPVRLGELIAVVDRYPVEESGDFMARVREAFPAVEDRRLIYVHYVEGDHSTAAAAGALGIEHLPPAEQARLVKQAKDRIAKKLRRMGVQP
jgi:hypothetical protein